ncbi:hypothetical protein [Streptomyces sp. SCA2-2]|uniref:hypothetical protein n=1 Tax=Streptomyces sp. SCA2-2 TaxID=1563677 RepID=UPI001022526B|nr:hypothetical protein [Streptomyces sp. SCA2-2]RZE89470.1 hypothetical protein C0L86_29085 [Streptomyces sp. SCA2-2]
MRVLPDPADLTDAQLRGVACLWCEGYLATATAVDLGMREQCSGVLWFPRACPDCAEAPS